MGGEGGRVGGWVGGGWLAGWLAGLAVMYSFKRALFFLKRIMQGPH